MPCVVAESEIMNGSLLQKICKICPDFRPDYWQTHQNHIRWICCCCLSCLFLRTKLSYSKSSDCLRSSAYTRFHLLTFQDSMPQMRYLLLFLRGCLLYFLSPDQRPSGLKDSVRISCLRSVSRARIISSKRCFGMYPVSSSADAVAHFSAMSCGTPDFSKSSVFMSFPSLRFFYTVRPWSEALRLRRKLGWFKNRTDNIKNQTKNRHRQTLRMRTASEKRDVKLMQWWTVQLFLTVHNFRRGFIERWWVKKTVCTFLFRYPVHVCLFDDGAVCLGKWFVDQFCVDGRDHIRIYRLRRVLVSDFSDWWRLNDFVHSSLICEWFRSFIVDLWFMSVILTDEDWIKKGNGSDDSLPFCSEAKFFFSLLRSQVLLFFSLRLQSLKQSVECFPDQFRVHGTNYPPFLNWIKIWDYSASRLDRKEAYDGVPSPRFPSSHYKEARQASYSSLTTTMLYLCPWIYTPFVTDIIWYSLCLFMRNSNSIPFFSERSLI